MPASVSGRHRAVTAAAWYATELLESRTLLSVAGSVALDAAASGAWNSGQAGFDSARVFLDLNNSGVYQSVDPSAITSASGIYSIPLRGVPAGTYPIVAQADGYVTSSPAQTLTVGGSRHLTANFAEAPEPLSGLTATTVSAQEIDVAWAINSDYASASLAIEIDRSTDGINFSSVGTVYGNSNSFADTSVSPDSGYWYRAEVVSGVGFSTDPISTGQVYSAPSPAYNLGSGFDSYNNVVLNWTSGSSSSTTFDVERAPSGSSSFTNLGSVSQSDFGIGQISFTDTTASDDTAYVYAIIANDNGVSSSAASIVVDTPPAAPANLVLRVTHADVHPRAAA